jgi:hypothetical protein
VRDFVYSSVLAASRYEELAALMFFNRQQQRFRAAIVAAIERYGLPEIVARDGALRFTVGDLGEVQSLYALDGDAVRGRLAGVMIFARTSPQKVVLLHIGVAPEYGSDGPHADRLLALRLVEQLKHASRAIKGVSELEIVYGRRATGIKLTPPQARAQ